MYDQYCDVNMHKVVLSHLCPGLLRELVEWIPVLCPFALRWRRWLTGRKHRVVCVAW